MSESKVWTGNLVQVDPNNIQLILDHLCQAFNQSPFMLHNLMSMRVVNNQIEGFFEMQSHLIGNVAYKILHGGVAATLLDSIGGIVAMGELYARSNAETFEQTSKSVAKLATSDIRIDYISPGRGDYFIARAEPLRMGRKSCLMRMSLHNDSQQLIATGIGSYLY